MAGRKKPDPAPADGEVLEQDGPETQEGEALTGDDDDGDEGWDAGGEHSTAIQRMENIADELELDTAGMVQEVRDFLLDTIKARPKPWSATSQAEQRDVAAACEHASRELVRKIVEAVAANGVDSIRVLLTKVTMGTDTVITGKVKVFGEEDEGRAIQQLFGALNKHVMLTRATAEDYSNGGEAETDPDEPDFGFEGDDDADEG